MGIKAPRENTVLRSILDWLKLNGAFPVRINSAAFAGTHNGKKRFFRANDQPGCSDIIACVGGVFVAIEVKKPGAKTEPVHLAEQLSFLQGVKRSGGIGVMVSSVDELIAELKKNNIGTGT